MAMTFLETSSSEPSIRERDLLILNELHIKRCNTFIPPERLDSFGSDFPSHSSKVQNPLPWARKTVIRHTPKRMEIT